MKFQIDYLADVPGMLDTLAGWHDVEWRHLNPAEYDKQARIAEYQLAAQKQHIPVMFVAHHEMQPLGSARLIMDDMETHPELYPWLASLYVHPDFRRRGIATQLIKRIEQQATDFGYHRIFLFTEHQQAFYQRLGWQLFSEEEYYQEQVTIMSKTLR